MASLSFHERSDGSRFFRFSPRLLPALEVKEIGGRWEESTRTWRLPGVVASIESLRRLYGADTFDLDERSRELDESEWGFPDKGSNWGEDLPLSVKKSLLGYQSRAVDYLLSSPHHGSLLALSPGLGKTLVAMTYAWALGAKRVLVISPLSLVDNWISELKKWFGISGTKCHGKPPSETGWTVTNYDTPARRSEEYEQDWDLVICDESILLKNHTTKRWRVVRNIFRKAKKGLLLSGLPTSRYADDLYGQLALLSPESWTSYWRFAHQYCYVVDSRWGTQISGTRTDRNLQKELRDFYYVVNQKDVLDLPKLRFETLKVSLLPEQARFYDDLVRRFVAQLDDETAPMTVTNRLTQLIRLQQCVSTPRNFGPEWPIESGKLSLLLELLDLKYLPLPTIVWTHWQETNNVLAQFLKSQFSNDLRVARLTSENSSQAGDVVSAFQKGQTDVLLMALSVGKYGHTLTRANSMVYYDKSWDADAYFQSVSRVHRLGLDHPTAVISLLCPGTVDEIVESNLTGKAVSIAHISNFDLAELLRSLTHE